MGALEGTLEGITRLVELVYLKEILRRRSSGSDDDIDDNVASLKRKQVVSTPGYTTLYFALGGYYES